MLIGVFLLVFVIALIGFNILNSVMPIFTQYFGADSQNAISTSINVSKMFDYVSLIGLVIYILVIVGSSALGGIVSPVFFVLNVILTVPVILFSGVISDFVTQIVASPIGGGVTNLPISYLIFQNLPLISILIFALSVIVGFYSSQYMMYGGGQTF